MKRIIMFILLAMMLVTLNVQAQNLKGDINNVIVYLQDNIGKIDPIEGVYDMEVELDLFSAYAGREYYCFNYSVAIYRESNHFIIESFSDENRGLFGAIERMGNKNNYSILVGDRRGGSKTFHFQLNDPYSFKYEEKDTHGTARAHFTYKYIKKFPTSDMYAKIEESKVDSKPSQWTGTGFALLDGYIATNYHVVENAKYIFVQGIKGDFITKYSATVIATDKYNDVALLHISDKNFNGFGKIPYQVKTSTSDVGEDIFVLGYPMTSTMGDEIKLTTGVISSKTGYQGDVSLYQISAPVQPGNSGGPLFDKQGNLIGIVSAKHKDAENVGYAIKASYLKNLVESAVSTSILPSTNSISNIPLTNKVKSLKNFVFMIKCSSSEAPIDYSNNTTISHDKTINNPIITTNCSWNTKVLSIRLSKDYTIVTLSDNNLTRDGGYYSWMTIDPQTYILANGQKYKLIKAEGIALSPSLTYFSHAGETKTFTLYFPPIPQTTSSIDLIESMTSEWRFYGIKID